MGTVAEKLSYLNETKQLFKDRLNSLGAEIIESTTFRNYLNWLDTFYGESSDKTDLAKNGVVGRTSQETTTGNNLLHINTSFSNFYGVTGTLDKNGLLLTGTATGSASRPISVANIPSGTYTAAILFRSGTHTSGKNLYLDYYNDTTQIGSQIFTDSNLTKTITLSEDITSIRFGWQNTDVFSNFKIDIMLNEGNTALSYEPYTGGKPSPSPDYPQEINNLSGDVEYKVRGKNLCNGINQNVYLNNNTNQCGIASNNSGLYISVNGGNYTISSSTTQARYRIACCNDIPTTLVSTAYKGQNKDNTNNSITIDTTGYSYLIVNATDLNAIMINEGSTALPYEPYISESFPLSLKSRNLFDVSTIGVINAYIANTGKITNSTNNRTIYTQLQPNTTYTLSFTKVDDNGNAVNFNTDDGVIGFYSSAPTVNDTLIGTITFTGTAGTTSTNKGNTGSAGSGTAFSVLDPYITVYMYKRTA